MWKWTYHKLCRQGKSVLFVDALNNRHWCKAALWKNINFKHMNLSLEFTNISLKYDVDSFHVTFQWYWITAWCAIFGALHLFLLEYFNHDIEELCFLTSFKECFNKTGNHEFRINSHSWSRLLIFWWRMRRKKYLFKLY